MKIFLVGVKPGITPLSAGLSIRGMTTDEKGNNFSVDEARKMAENLVKGVKIGPLVATDNAYSNLGNFFYMEDATNHKAAESKSSTNYTTNNTDDAKKLEEKIANETRQSIEMKMSQAAAVKGPELPADIDIGVNVFERAMAAAMKAQVNEVIRNLMPDINKIINHEIQTNFVKRLEIKVNDGDFQNVGAQHKTFPELVRLCLIKLPNGSRLNTWLVGPAGTGKTTACENAAKAIKAREFGAIGTSDNKYELSGFVDAHGKVVNTVFRDIFINGGLMLLDEIDSWYPNALLAIQAALANNFCAFPDGVFKRHEDCVIVCAANTYGQGEVTEYVGRMKQDAAFLDRFVYLKWEIDEQLERHISGNKEWVTRVQSVRRRAAEKQVKVLITPRASQYGSAMLAAGIPWNQVEDMVLRKSMTPEQWKSVQ